MILRQPTLKIGPDEVHVWHLLADTPAHDGLRPLLAASEIARLECLRHARDRDLFLWSRCVIRSVISGYLDCAGHELSFGANNFGKPILQTPGNDPPLCFNLTHSRGAVALAVSVGREVGIDVEERRRRVEYLGLAQRYFAPDEARHLEQLHEDDRPDAFFAIWTLKEAYVKGLGRGLTFPLDAFSFDLDRHRLVAFRPLRDFVDCDWHFHQFALGQHHCGALAVQGKHVSITLHDWASAFGVGT